MAESTLVKPDLDFVREITSSGGESLKKCFQCATCSVVCNVSPDKKPFPRREMIYAQWGLKDKLIANPNIWVCHQCSDCTAYCPRGAKPGEVLGTIRKMAIKKYAWPQFMGNLVANPKSLTVILAIPVIFFLAVLALLGNLGIPEGEIVFSKFFPVWPAIDGTFGAIAAFAAFAFVMGVIRFWNDMKINNPKEVNKNPWSKKWRSDFLPSIYSVLGDIITHRRFKKCDVNLDRSNAHLLVFYGFVGLAITTTIAIIYLYGMHWESPYPQTDPMKILGNISALSLFAGTTLVIMNRLKNKAKLGGGSYFDWLFIGIVYALVISGILTELTRLAGIATMAYPIYFIHLVFVFCLFAYAPYSKLAHMVYRTVALVFAKQKENEDLRNPF